MNLASPAREHVIRLEETRPGRWRAVCSCDMYRSSSYAYKGHAESAGEQHIRAKGGPL